METVIVRFSFAAGERASCLLFPLVLLAEQEDALLQHAHLALEVLLILKQRVMHGGAAKDEDERRDHIAGHAQQGLQLSGIGAIALV